MSKLYVVGFGPGGYEHMTVKAVNVINSVDVVTGYTTYIEMLKAYFPEKNYLSTPMRKEVERCRLAVEKTMEGNDVAMVISGDSGIYGMAGIVLQIVEEMHADIEVEVVPGVTAASAAAAVLGAPLMHDLTIISLSDLMTPLEQIMKRVECAAMGDFVVCLYNPKSKKRTDYIYQAADIMMKYQKPETPVGIVRNACRDGQTMTLTTLGTIHEAEIDMFSIVIVGNSQTYIKDGKMITPRGYTVS